MHVFNDQRNLDDAPVARVHRRIGTVHLVRVLEGSNDVQEILGSVDGSELAQVRFRGAELSPLRRHVPLFLVGATPSERNVEFCAHAVHALQNTLLPVHLQAAAGLHAAVYTQTWHQLYHKNSTTQVHDATMTPQGLVVQV